MFVQCRELTAFVKNNPARITSWVPATLQNALAPYDGFFTVRAEPQIQRSTTFAELMRTVDSCPLPDKVPFDFLVLWVEHLQGAPDSD